MIGWTHRLKLLVSSDCIDPKIRFPGSRFMSKGSTMFMLTV